MFACGVLMHLGALISVVLTLDFIRPVRRKNPFASF